MSQNVSKLLVVEDVDYKYEEIMVLLATCIPETADKVRVKTVVEAEDRINEHVWDLIVLDISMDISQSSAGPMREGHANLGGLDLVEHMFLMEREMPTLIITGFDYFPGRDSSGHSEGLTLVDLEARARGWIGDKLLGCIKYGSASWKTQVSQIIESRCVK